MQVTLVLESSEETRRIWYFSDSLWPSVNLLSVLDVKLICMLSAYEFLAKSRLDQCMTRVFNICIPGGMRSQSQATQTSKRLSYEKKAWDWRAKHSHKAHCCAACWLCSAFAGPLNSRQCTVSHCMVISWKQISESSTRVNTFLSEHHISFNLHHRDDHNGFQYSHE